MKTVGTVLVLFLSSTLALSAATVTVFHSPGNDGGEGTTVAIPDNGTPVTINIWLRPPGSISAGPTRCSGDPNSTGFDVCMWDLHVLGTNEVVFEDFVGAPGVVGHIDNTGPDPILRVNGGEAEDPNAPAVVESVGVLTVSAAGGSGEVRVIGNQWLDTHQVLVTIAPDSTPGGQPLGLVGADPDTDGDTLPDSIDNCLLVANASQAASVQPGLTGIACACLCGDVNNSCTVSSVDVQDIRVQILPNLGAGNCYQIGSPDDQATCGASPQREVRGCDVNASASCSGVDSQVIQLDLPGIAGGAVYPLSNGFDPENCAQNTPDPCGDNTPCP